MVSSPDDLCSSFSDFYISLFTAAETDPSAQSEMLGNLTLLYSPLMRL